MQKITIEVKDNYTDNVIEMLHSLKGIMIEKIDYHKKDTQKVDNDLMKLQIKPMKNTWDNKEDEAWNEL